MKVCGRPQVCFLPGAAAEAAGAVVLVNGAGSAPGERPEAGRPSRPPGRENATGARERALGRKKGSAPKWPRTRRSSECRRERRGARSWEETEIGATPQIGGRSQKTAGPTKPGQRPREHGRQENARSGRIQGAGRMEGETRKPPKVRRAARGVAERQDAKSARQRRSRAQARGRDKWHRSHRRGSGTASTPNGRCGRERPNVGTGRSREKQGNDPGRRQTTEPSRERSDGRVAADGRRDGQRGLTAE